MVRFNTCNTIGCATIEDMGSLADFSNFLTTASITVTLHLRQTVICIIFSSEIDTVTSNYTWSRIYRVNAADMPVSGKSGKYNSGPVYRNHFRSRCRLPEMIPWRFPELPLMELVTSTLVQWMRPRDTRSYLFKGHYHRGCNNGYPYAGFWCRSIRICTYRPCFLCLPKPGDIAR